MRVTKINIDGFRNLENVSVKPHKNLNVICGNNAQGKTNIMEAIWLCTGLKSFRGANDREMIGFCKDKAAIEVSFENSEREQTAQIELYKNPFSKKLSLNGVPLKNQSEMSKGLNAVYFTPDDLSLAKGSPDCRRIYLDQCITQIKPSYRQVYAKYTRLINQRNNTLKQIASGLADIKDLDIWDFQIAQTGSYISLLRYIYTGKLDKCAAMLYEELTQGKEIIELDYRSTVFDYKPQSDDFRGVVAQSYYQVLKETRENDIKFATTSVGVHRDDLKIKLDRRIAKEHGSQGQIRSIALCMKLAQAYILNEELEEMPIMLLDDVLSELDPIRQDFILGRIDNMQVFISCCEPTDRLGKNIFNVRNGRITE